MKIDYEQTASLIRSMFAAYGFTDEESEIITKAFLAADLAGIESHGIQRMIRYNDAIKMKMVDITAVPETLWETPVSAVIDAKKCMGQLISVKAMNMAIEKAEKCGIGAVAVRNSNHFGIAGYYARMASCKGMAGITMTNSEAIMVPTFSKRAMLGTNPIAVAFPAEPVDFCFDAATTVVTRGKLEVYRKDEASTPDDWMLDEEGKPCNNPDKVITNISGSIGGGILPLGGDNEVTGGHKGYGFGMICELFTSIFAGGPPSYKSYKHPGVADTSHFFMAINCNLFGNPENLKKSCSVLLDDIRKAEPCNEGARIYIHGEKEVEFAENVRRNGIPVNQKTVEELKEIANELNVPCYL